MSGQKGRSGGARQGAGLPYRKRLNLDRETAQTLRVLLLHRRGLLNQPALTEEQVVASLIDASWHELDESCQQVEEAIREWVK